ncbi:MAG: regulatory protein RecX [Thermoanaerobaculia bacterium]
MPRRPSPDQPPIEDPEKCYEAALRLLGYRWRSSEELRLRLRRRNFSAAVIERTIERLTGAGWVDDERFASEMARSLLRRKRGPRRVLQELRQFGIDQAGREAALSGALQEEPAERHLRELCRRRIRMAVRSRGREWLVSDQERNKLIAYLLNHGYDYESVADVVKDELQRAASNEAES